MPLFDLTVITTRDRDQQWLFEQRLAAIPWSTLTRDVMVVADPPGPRPGSGGSTLLALCAALDRLGLCLGENDQGLEKALSERRILILHSGGPTLAEPLIATLERAFDPAPGESKSLSTFEAVVESLSRLTSTAPGGVTLACGDVLYRASPPPSFPEADAVAWACPARLPQASRHGVFLWDAASGLARQALQKPGVSALRDLGFEDEAPLDTGVLHLSPCVAATLVAPLSGTGTAAGTALARRDLWQGLDLYRDLLPALCSEGGGRGSTSPIIARFAKFRLRVLCPEDGRFTHFGTLEEVRTLRDEIRVPAGGSVRIRGRQEPGTHEVGGERRPRTSAITQKPPQRGGRTPDSTDWDNLTNAPAGDVETRTRAHRIIHRLQSDPDLSAATLCAELSSEERLAVGVEVGQLARRLETGDSRSALEAARAWRLCAALAGETRPEQPFHTEAFASIRRTLAPDSRAIGDSRWCCPVGARVAAEAPVRIDLAGGWTDTPPQACEMGGRVLNIALRLNGALPVRAAVRILPEPVIRFSAIDLGLDHTVASIEELRDCGDPSAAFALHKAALLECGLFPPGTSDLRSHLRRLGGGLHLETDARVPKGSGLGTSSILGAAVMACLRGLTGQEASWQALFSDVLAVEQRITSGGGWQDQVGGLLPGIKLTTTEPGMVQCPEVQPVHCPPEVLAELEARLVLYYTGVPRLARNVLQRVVSRYLARDEGVRPALRRMAKLASETAVALAAGDFPVVGAALRESWRLNQFLEPTATHPGIDAIIGRVAAHCDGWKLAGAGGGGFLVLLAASGDAAGQVRDILAAQPEGQLFNASVSPVGLTLQVPTWNTSPSP